MSALVKPIAALDVPLNRLEADLHTLVARQRAQARVDAAVARLRWLLAHPEAVAAAPHASDGEAAELRHLLYDADPDDTTRPFVDLRKGIAA